MTEDWRAMTWCLPHSLHLCQCRTILPASHFPGKGFGVRIESRFPTILPLLAACPPSASVQRSSLFIGYKQRQAQKVPCIRLMLGWWLRKSQERDIFVLRGGPAEDTVPHILWQGEGRRFCPVPNTEQTAGHFQPLICWDSIVWNRSWV